MIREDFISEAYPRRGSSPPFQHNGSKNGSHAWILPWCFGGSSPPFLFLVLNHLRYPRGLGVRVCLVTEEGSYLRLIDFCITQLKAQGPSRTCNESKEEEQALASASVLGVAVLEGCCESRRCSRDTYPQSYITKYTSIRRLGLRVLGVGVQGLGCGVENSGFRIASGIPAASAFASALGFGVWGVGQGFRVEGVG